MKKVQLKLFSKNSMLLLFFTVLSLPILHAQTTTIKGVVTDENNQPLPGASLVVKGTTNGTQTDFDGNYTIDAKNNAILVISYIGYENKNVSIQGKTTINVSLVPSSNQIDEVVIIGYGTQKKSDLTGAVSAVSSKDIDKYTYNDASQALQGRMAGVSVKAQGGAPGAGSVITIRGAGTLSDAGPLYVIDGMIGASMSSLNPSDIANVSVLKDASATAIYGSRAANGVVIITTKKGKKGDISIDIDHSSGIQKVIKTYDWANARQYADIVNSANDNDGQARIPANDTEFDPNYSSDLYGESLRTSMVQNTSLRVSGGNDNATYSLSLGEFKNEGIVKYSDYRRTTARANTTFKKGKFQLESTIGLTRTISNPNPYFNKERNLLPTIRLKDDNGNWSGSDIDARGFSGTALGSFYGPGTIKNELAFAALEDRTITRNTVVGNVAGSFEILKGLTYKLNFGIQHYSDNNYKFTPFEAGGVIASGGNASTNELTERNTNYLSTLTEHTLNYKKAFGNHSFDLLGGYTEQINNSRFLGVVAVDFPSNNTRVASAGTNQSTNSNDLTSSIQSYFGRINYSFDSRYLVTATLRKDGSSLFKEGNRWGTFPSAALGWNLSNEDFMQDVDALTNIKLRVSYGEIGSNNVPVYATDPELNLNSEYILNGERVTGYSITKGVNPLISWETTKTTDIGLEFDALDNKLVVAMDYFEKKSEDVLVGLRLPLYTGFGNAIPFNTASIENKGFEFLATYRDQVGEFKYSATVNFSTLNNVVTALGDATPIIQGSFTSNTLNSTKTDVGQPISSFFGYITDGIYQTDQEVIDANDTTSNPVPGDMRFKDIDGDGDIDSDDQTYIGNPTPNFEYGFNLSAEYKGFDLNLFFNGVSGNKILNGTKYRGYFDFNGNYFADALNGWTPTNTNTNIPRNTQTDKGNNRRMSSFYLEDGSYFRLRNAQIGYTIPRKFVEKLKISKLRIYTSATNLFTITKYKGYYPEVGRNGRNANGRSIFNTGVDEGAYPTPRMYQLGLQLSF
jgi:TonB-linked SusC/RagA family outer membrane protein